MGSRGLCLFCERVGKSVVTNHMCGCASTHLEGSVWTAVRGIANIIETIVSIGAVEIIEIMEIIEIKDSWK